MNVYITSMREMKKFGDYIYKDATIFLKRKHDIYLKLINHLSTKQPKSSKFFGVTKTIQQGITYYFGSVVKNNKTYRFHGKNELEIAKKVWNKALELQVASRKLSEYPNPYNE
jgi:hypothetical protein